MTLRLDAPAITGQRFIELGREVATKILHTIEAGWTLALSSQLLNVALHEVEMTELLRDGMREALKSEELGLKGRMVVLSGTETRSQPEVLSPDGLTDIPIFIIKIFLQIHVHDPHAVIECKRISGTDTNLCRNYVVEGIDRFQTGKYAGQHSTGFMVGYLLCGTAKEAADGVNRYLDNKSRSEENLIGSTLINKSLAWQSMHKRPSSTAIELHHSFLSF